MSSEVYLDRVLLYAEKGWKVFPLYGIRDSRCTCNKAKCGKDGGKHPLVTWKSQATTDPTQIAAWWKKWPDANIGITAGKGSGLLIIDVDGQDGFDTFEEWRQTYNWDANTLTATSGKGLHLYFKYPGEVVKNAVRVVKGIDVRAEGGYIVAAPSRHLSGNQYAWINWGTDPAPVPSWLLDIIKNENPQPASFTETDGDIPEGSRNETLFKIGSGMRGRGEEYDAILAVLNYTNRTRCKPPVEDSEVETIAKSAASQEVNYSEFAEDAAALLSSAGADSPLWWFPFSVRTWSQDQNVMLMADYQVGWFISLLAECWKTGGRLPNDLATLAKFARAKSKKAFFNECALVLQPFKESDDGEYLIHPVMKDLWRKKYIDVQQKKIAGKERWAAVAKKNKEEEKAKAA